MTGLVRLSSWPAALCSGMLLAGCAPESEFSTVGTSPVTMVCDGGRTFTISYADAFETAIIEADGQRLELARLYTSSTMTPTSRALGPRAGALFDRTDSRGFDTSVAMDRRRGGVSAAAPAGIRYGNDEALFISRNRAAVLQVGDDTYSNCAVART